MRWDIMAYAFANGISLDQAIKELAEEAIAFFEALLDAQ